MQIPKMLWFFRPGTQDISIVLPLRDLHNDLAQFIVVCPGCLQRFLVKDIRGVSWDAYGALSTQRAIMCPHCEYRCWLRGGVVTLATHNFCPACGLQLNEPAFHGWVQCSVCSWEGRLSDTLTTQPNDLDAPDAA